MKQTLTQRIEALESQIMRMRAISIRPPYTAQASTGDCKCVCHPTLCEKYGYSCQKCWALHETEAHKPQPITDSKPNKELREKIFDMLSEELNTDIAGGLADDIYALINN